MTRICKLLITYKVKLLRGSARGQSSVTADDEFHYAYVDLMRGPDATAAVARLDGVVRLDAELLISIAGLDEELSIFQSLSICPALIDVRKNSSGWAPARISAKEKAGN